MLRISHRRFWNKPSVNSRKNVSYGIFLTLWASLSATPQQAGKAHDTVIPSLPRVRGKLLQRHPWTPWTYGILNFCNDRVKVIPRETEGLKKGWCQ